MGCSSNNQKATEKTTGTTIEASTQIIESETHKEASSKTETEKAIIEVATESETEKTETSINEKISTLTFMDEDIDEDHIIQELKKLIGEETSKNDILNSSRSVIGEYYVWEDFEIVDGFYGTLEVDTEDTLLTHFRWVLSGYTEKRGAELYQIIQELLADCECDKNEDEASKYYVSWYHLKNDGCLSVCDNPTSEYDNKFDISYDYKLHFSDLS